MSIFIENTTINIFQGDSGNISFCELPPGITVYMSIRDKRNELVFPELSNTVDENGNVTFEITADMSDEFIVNANSKYATYYYGLKQVDIETGEENTILLGEDPKFEDKYIMRVYLKKVEGI